MTFNKKTLKVISVFAAGISLQAFAQIEEIVITSEKREANVQDTPIAVSAFSGEALETAGIDDALDIQFSVPNVVFSKGNFTGANMSIRGIGNSAVGVSSDSGAGVHVNGVYLNSPRIFETEFFDVERVEMLRGPQGTLYGRNTTAGVVNVITAKPDDEFGADVSITLGNYDTVKLKGMVNFPITDSISQRFAAFSLKRDGYIDNVYTGNDIDDRDMYAFRSTTAFNFSDTVDATFMFSKFREDDSRSRVSKQQCTTDPDGVLGCLPDSLGFDVWNGSAGVTAGVNDFVLGLPPFNAPLIPVGVNEYANSVNPADFRKVNADFDPHYFVEETIASLEFNWQLDGAVFTSLTAYSNAYVNTKTDYDWTVPSVPFNYPVVGYFNGVERVDATFDSPTDESSDDSEQFSQEFRIVSESDGMFNYTLGLFAMQFEADNHYIVYFPVGYQFGQFVGIPEHQSLFDNHNKGYKVSTWALFGEGYWDLTDNTKLTVGLRYTDEAKEILGRQYYLTFKASTTDPFIEQEEDWQEVTGKIGLDWNVTDDVMLYTTLARGYKGGGFNPPGNTSFPDSFDPEYINSLEFGLKSSLFESRMQANLSAFYYDYEGLQISKIVSQTSINENVDATIQGVEAEFLFAPNESWLFGLNLAYLDAEIGDVQTFDPTDPAQTGSAQGVVSVFGDNFLIADGSPGIEIDLEGNKLPNAPEFSVNANAEYTHEFSSGYTLSGRIQYYWQDEFYSRIFNTSKDEIDSWGVLDAQVTLADPSGLWSLQAWVKNIKNDDFVTGHYTTDATSGLFTNVFVLEPRTAGLTLDFSF